ncbi:complex I NDUFA9 subunit family protein [Devosia rhodophyticola]|uniref:Complex I NDUFA9 subunit family protein n=1 Tax=Devosia rhodophyticola TaxID=3026423 RepID=A0ABY7Z1A6_9HYPH|nr:complex I NDUFA9 subunit family protein [Devosia rhodophyticola]WDR07262.1 complex I NDUFA9 subunit family protein [Devosia rhodophyticola]
MDHLHQRLVTVFGGSGFVGTQVVQTLARRGYRVRVAVRRPDLAGHLKPLGAVGQIQPIQANVRNMASIQRAVAGADFVINLVGIGYEGGKQRFGVVHVEGAAAVARAAKAAGATSLVHMSALGADAQSESNYASSKGAGEAAVMEAFPQAIIMRPSIVFGRGDGFFNLMGTLARWLPVMPLIGGQSNFQPAYVGDVAEAFVLAAESKVKTGRTYELGGPEVLTHKALLELVLRETLRTRPLFAMPTWMANIVAFKFSLLPFPPLLTADQIKLLAHDNKVSDEARSQKRTFAAFGIAPTSMETILPSYMWRFRRNGQFDRPEERQNSLAE